MCRAAIVTWLYSNLVRTPTSPLICHPLSVDLACADFRGKRVREAMYVLRPTTSAPSPYLLLDRSGHHDRLLLVHDNKRLQRRW